MPITFEEVTAEVPAERPAPPAEASREPTPADGDAATERLMQALALRHERERRVQAD